MNQEKYIGMDVHQATISVAVMDSCGKMIMECILGRKRPRFLSSSRATGKFIRGLRRRNLCRLVA